jgi:hypothetical protein
MVGIQGIARKTNSKRQRKDYNRVLEDIKNGMAGPISIT